MRTLEDLERALERGLNEWENQIVERNAGVMGERIIAHIKRKTHVISGNLRRRWFKKVEKRRGQVVIWLKNDAEYAEAVNNGHRVVRGGRTVGYVEGQRMLEKGVEEYKQSLLSSDVERMLQELRSAVR